MEGRIRSHLVYRKVWAISLKKTVYTLFIPLAFLLCAFMLFNLSVNKPLDHDEHQFVASAKLLQAEGYQPYVDFAYFHMPYLLYVYQVLYDVTDHLLLSSRLFSSLCGFLIAVAIFITAYRRFPEESLQRFGFAGLMMLFLIANPIFVHTSGLAWNHESATLLAVLAFLMYVRTMKQNRSWIWAFLSGALLGVATGIRLSFAPLFAPFFILPFIYRQSISNEFIKRTVIAFSAGFAVAMLPAGLALLSAPEAFWFGNFQYPGLNTAFRYDIGYGRAMSLPGKLLFSLEILAHPGNLVLVGLAIAFAFRRCLSRTFLLNRNCLEITFILLLLPFLLLGVFAPTPTFNQYYFALIPFLILAIIYGITFPFADKERSTSVATVLIVLASIFSLPQYPTAGMIQKANDWQPIQLKRMGERIAELTGGEGKVMTFAPIVALEAGLDIYPQFATGPFGWRSAPFLDAEQRKQFDIWGEADLQQALTTDAPVAILTGFEWREDPKLGKYAEWLNMKKIVLSERHSVWIQKEKATH